MGVGDPPFSHPRVEYRTPTLFTIHMLPALNLTFDIHTCMAYTRKVIRFIFTTNPKPRVIPPSASSSLEKKVVVVVVKKSIFFFFYWYATSTQSGFSCRSCI